MYVQYLHNPVVGEMVLLISCMYIYMYCTVHSSGCNKHNFSCGRVQSPKTQNPDPILALPMHLRSELRVPTARRGYLASRSLSITQTRGMKCRAVLGSTVLPHPALPQPH